MKLSKRATFAERWLYERASLIESQIVKFLAQPNLPPYVALHVRDSCELTAKVGEVPQQRATCTTKRLRGQSQADIAAQLRDLGPSELILLRGTYADDAWPELPEPKAESEELLPLRADPLFAACGLKPTYVSSTRTRYVPK